MIQSDTAEYRGGSDKMPRRRGMDGNTLIIFSGDGGAIFNRIR